MLEKEVCVGPFCVPVKMMIMEIILNFAGGIKRREEEEEEGEKDETEEERREKERGYDIQRMRGTGKGQ